MRSTTPPLLALAATAGLLLAACATTPDAAEPSEPETIAVTTPAGADIEAPAEPAAALGFYTTDVDILVTLGFELAGTQPVREGDDGFPDFFPAVTSDLDTFGNFPEYNLERVLAAGPDLILNGLGYEEDLDAQLQDVAPTYTYNAFDGADWRDAVGLAAADLGRDAEWQAWSDAYEARVADIRARLDAAGVDPVVADVASFEGQTWAQCRGVPCLVFADLGLRIAPIANASAEGLPEGDAEQLSAERLDELDGIDVAFSVAGDDASRAAVEDTEGVGDSPLWADLPFVADGEIHPYALEMTFGSPSGQDAFLTIVEEALLG